MKYHLSRKVFVLGIMILFLGIYSSPIIGQNRAQDDHVEKKEDVTCNEEIFDWPMFHHDVCHTGYSLGTNYIPNEDFLEEKWSYKTNEWVYSSPALGDINNDGTIEVIVGSWDYNVYTLDGISGSLLWKYKTGDLVDSSTALGDVNSDGIAEVIIGSWDAGVYALSGINGSLIWKYLTGSTIRSSPVLGDINNDGTIEIIVGSLDSNVYALCGVDGDLIWKYTTGNLVFSSPALGDVNNDGTIEVIVGSDDFNVYALNGMDGSLIWKYATEAWVGSSPALGDINNDGIIEVVIGSSGSAFYGNGSVSALSGVDGKLVWKHKLERGVDSSPALGDINNDGIIEVIVGSYDGNIYVLSGVNGDLVWKYTTGYMVDSCPALGDINNDGIIDVVVGSYDYNVYALSGLDGNLIWKYTTKGKVGSSPALGDIDGDGYIEIVIGSYDGNVYALDRDNNPPFVSLRSPRDGYFYIMDRPIQYVGRTIIFRGITCEVEANDGLGGSGIDRVEFYIDDSLREVETDSGSDGFYEWKWNEHIGIFCDHSSTVKAIACDKAGNTASSEEVDVWIWNP